MRNSFLLYRETPETTVITTTWRSSQLHISPDGQWLVTVALIEPPPLPPISSSSRFFSYKPQTVHDVADSDSEYLVTWMHVPSASQREIVLKAAGGASGGYVSCSTDDEQVMVEFWVDQKTLLTYAGITLRGETVPHFLWLDSQRKWVEETTLEQKVLSNLHIMKPIPPTNCRFETGGKTVHVRHSLRYGAPFVSIIHPSRVRTVMLLQPELVFTADGNTAKLTTIQVKEEVVSDEGQ
jgi:hypothetical protein